MGLCEHGRRRRQSDECGNAPAFASTGGSATSARTAAAKASIVVVRTRSKQHTPARVEYSSCRLACTQKVLYSIP
eukprot:scaffold15780_cov68-Phaeocystis_antarctica.AAC.18